MKGLFKPKKIEPHLELFFDHFDAHVQNQSSHM